MGLLIRFCLLGALVGCSADARAGIGVTREEVTAGTPDANDDAVVALATSDGSLVCTGTLIAPGVVLTAAHCLEGGAALAEVRSGSDARKPERIIDIQEAHAHPRFDPATLANDVAVLVLAEDAAGITPWPVAHDDALVVGAALRTVGFGRTGPLTDGPSAGTRRAGVTAVEAVTGDSVTVGSMPSQPCSGDSGGPLVANDGRIVAVVSNGDSDCRSGAAAARVEAATDFIEPFLAAQAASASCGVGAPAERGARLSIFLFSVLAVLAIGRRSRSS